MIVTIVSRNPAQVELVDKHTFQAWIIELQRNVEDTVEALFACNKIRKFIQNNTCQKNLTLPKTSISPPKKMVVGKVLSFWGAKGLVSGANSYL